MKEYIVTDDHDYPSEESQEDKSPFINLFEHFEDLFFEKFTFLDEFNSLFLSLLEASFGLNAWQTVNGSNVARIISETIIHIP